MWVRWVSRRRRWEGQGRRGRRQDERRCRVLVIVVFCAYPMARRRLLSLTGGAKRNCEVFTKHTPYIYTPKCSPTNLIPPIRTFWVTSTLATALRTSLCRGARSVFSNESASTPPATHQHPSGPTYYHCESCRLSRLHGNPLVTFDLILASPNHHHIVLVLLICRRLHLL